MKRTPPSEGGHKFPDPDETLNTVNPCIFGCGCTEGRSKRWSENSQVDPYGICPENRRSLRDLLIMVRDESHMSILLRRQVMEAINYLTEKIRAEDDEEAQKKC